MNTSAASRFCLISNSWVPLTMSAQPERDGRVAPLASRPSNLRRRKYGSALKRDGYMNVTRGPTLLDYWLWTRVARRRHKLAVANRERRRLRMIESHCQCPVMAACLQLTQKLCGILRVDHRIKALLKRSERIRMLL